MDPPAPLALADPPLPCDDADGGCDADPPAKFYKAWTREHPAIPIADQDVILDDGKEIYSYLKQHGIKNLLVMGVHANMCVLNRSFAIKQMTKWGIHCVLVGPDRRHVQPEDEAVRQPRGGDGTDHRAHRKVLVPERAEGRPCEGSFPLTG